MTTVTFSKQCIHFLRSLRWPLISVSRILETVSSWLVEVTRGQLTSVGEH